MARYGKARRFEFEGVTGTANEHADRLGISLSLVYGRFYRSMGGRSVVKEVGIPGEGHKRPPKERVWHKKVCRMCSRRFVTLNPRYFMCSPECSKKNTLIRCRRPSKAKSKKCPTCGTEFITSNAVKVYCCAGCWPKPARRIYHRTCKNCRKEFSTDRHDKFFCNKRCHRKKPSSGTWMTMGDGVCLRCPMPLPKPRPINQKFCSKRCAKRPATFVGLLTEPRNCDKCGNPIPLPRQPKAKYCSRKCSVRVYRMVRNRKPYRRLRVMMSKALRDALRKRHKGNRKNASIMKYTGCTIHQLVEQFERQFSEGMNWSNHSTFGWHIDHIIPLARFDLTKEEHRHVALHHTNLRPLWWEENGKKSDQIIHAIIPPALLLKANMLGVITC